MQVTGGRVDKIASQCHSVHDCFRASYGTLQLAVRLGADEDYTAARREIGLVGPVAPEAVRTEQQAFTDSAHDGGSWPATDKRKRCCNRAGAVERSHGSARGAA